jgi:hypothetical protein
LKNKKNIEIFCPLGCNKRIRGISKNHWLHNFEQHLTGKEHRILDARKRKDMVERLGKKAIEKL